MARQAILAGFPAPILVNETQTNQAALPGALLDSSVSSRGPSLLPLTGAGTMAPLLPPVRVLAAAAAWRFGQVLQRNPTTSRRFWTIGKAKI